MVAAQAQTHAVAVMTAVAAVNAVEKRVAETSPLSNEELRIKNAELLLKLCEFL